MVSIGGIGVSIFKNDLLRDKIALVTGASRGIGRAISIELARAGAHVVLVSRNLELLKETEKVISSNKGWAISFAADVANLSDMHKVFVSIEKDFGHLDILVNSAGISPHYTAFHKAPLEDWNRIIDVNIIGTLNSCKLAFPLLIKCSSSSIINISSIGGVIGLPKVAVYTATKGAITTFTKAIAIEWAPYNIRVNAICPGFIETDMTSGLSSKSELRDQLISRIPIGRFGKPEEVAKAAVFLASDGASYITGHCLIIDGGWTAG